MNNQLPDGWKIKTLDEICSWIGVGIATSTTHAYTESGIPILRNQNILQISIRDSDMLNITKEFSNENQSKMLREGDIVTIRTGYPGISAVIPRKYDGCHSFTTLISRPQKEIVNSYYLSILINSDYGRTFVLGGQAGGAQQNLNVSVLKQFPVVLPPLPEQQKIAVIFTSVDEVIEKTQAQINKLKDLKTGMMQELLTRGVGVDGKPHTEFKDSPVGRIPKGWEVKSIGELAEQVKPGPFGSSLTKSMYVKSGYKVYGQQQIISGDLNVGDYYVDKEKYDSLHVFKIQAGEVLISLVGTFGKVVVVPERFEEGIINPRLLKLRFDNKIANPNFIAYQLRSEFVLNQLNQFQQGGTMGVLSATTIKPVKLVVPPLNEQFKISGMISAIDKNLECKNLKLNSVKKVKQALMQDLLTGKVRVKLDS